MKPWEPVKIDKYTDYYWQAGPLSLWIRRNEDEWLVAYESQSANADSEEFIIAQKRENPGTLEPTRYVLSENSGIIQLLPVLQDRAVVVGSEIPVRILPKNRALFFVSIPVWIRILIGEKKNRITLTEIPTINLSNTWFGDPMTGELGYSLTTSARRSIEDSIPSLYRAVCPVWIINSSQAALDFQKLSIHVEHLRVYGGKLRIWTNEVRITFTGEDQLSRIDFSDKKPALEEGCTMISDERTPVDKSLLKKSVSILRYFTTIE